MKGLRDLSELLSLTNSPLDNELYSEAKYNFCINITNLECASFKFYMDRSQSTLLSLFFTIS